MGAVSKYGQWKENVVHSWTENVKNENEQPPYDTIYNENE